MDQMIKLGYCAITEARTDWLTLETLFIAGRLGVLNSDIAELSRNIRRVFLEQTEKLASLALLNDEITMGDIADAVKMHYTALPRKMFGDVQLPRNKSVDPKRLSPI